MALHGEIRVNGILLATWSARRTTPITGYDEEHVYDCDVQWRFDLRRPDARYTFSVLHRYSEGGTALAAKVLAEAASRAPAPPSLPTSERTS